MTDKNWPEKLAESLEQNAGKELKDKIICSHQHCRTLEEKALWAKETINKLDQLIPDIRTRKKIMSKCSCACFDERFLEFRDKYKEIGDIDKLLELMYQNPFFVKPHREGNTIYFTKAPHQKEEYEKAVTNEEKQKYYCHCEYAKGAEGGISLTHCYCGASWYKNIMEAILEKEVEIEVVESIMHGGKKCVIAIHM